VEYIIKRSEGAIWVPAMGYLLFESMKQVSRRELNGILQMETNTFQSVIHVETKDRTNQHHAHHVPKLMAVIRAAIANK
jgi:hypothetical protein